MYPKVRLNMDVDETLSIIILSGWVYMGNEGLQSGNYSPIRYKVFSTVYSITGRDFLWGIRASERLVRNSDSPTTEVYNSEVRLSEKLE